MAPEMFDKHAPDRSAADVYAFGVTLFQMLCGVRPFVSSLKSELIEMHRYTEPSFDLLAGNNVPDEVTDLLRRCLAKSPKERPESFESIGVEIQRAVLDQFGYSIHEEPVAALTGREVSQRALSFVLLGDRA